MLRGSGPSSTRGHIRFSWDVELGSRTAGQFKPALKSCSVEKVIVGVRSQCLLDLRQLFGVLAARARRRQLIEEHPVEERDVGDGIVLLDELDQLGNLLVLTASTLLHVLVFDDRNTSADTHGKVGELVLMPRRPAKPETE